MIKYFLFLFNVVEYQQKSRRKEGNHDSFTTPIFYSSSRA